MESKMTQITSSIFNSALNPKMTINRAISYLEKEVQVRTLADKLKKYYHGSDIKKSIVNGLSDNHTEMSRDSIERKVRNWLNDSSLRSLRKKDAIELCFVFGLELDDADAFTASVSGEKLHWRNPEEIAFIFSLANKKSYSYAELLQEKINGILSAKLQESKNASDYSDSVFTSIVKAEISKLHNEEELFSYISDNYYKFGKLHNKAYNMFTEMINRLSDIPDDELTEIKGEHLSIRDVLKDYFYDDIIGHDEKRESKDNSFSERNDASLIIKLIRENWPDETALSKMKSRSIDVSRKALILLFLATCEWSGDDDYEPTSEELFSDIYSRINDFLSVCGFPELDPRVPFDWLIIYSICVPDLYDVDKKMKTMLRNMFGVN